MDDNATIAQLTIERDEARRIAKEIFDYLYPMLTDGQKQTSEAGRARDLVRDLV